MANQGIFTGGVKIRSLNGYLIAVNGEVFATTNTGGTTDAFFYKAKTTITSGDPGSGHLIWNNATQISATQLNVSHLTDTPEEDIDLFLAAIVSGNKLVVQDREESINYQSWTVSGAPTQVGSTYWTIPVTFLESSGTGTTGFSNSHKLLFAIISGGTGGGGITTNAVTFNNSGSGAASGTSFNGATAVTVSYNTFGAQQASASLSSLAGLSYASGTPFVKMTAAGTFALDTNTYLTANQTITLSGNVTGSGTTSITTTIGTNVVTNAMLAQIATARIKGRVTAGTGNVEDLTGTQVTALLDNFTSALKGLAPASGGGTTNFLRADGTWAAPAGGGGSPAGSNTQIQYNNSGAFGASANFTWDNSTQNLAIGSGTAPAYITMLANNTSNGWGGRILAQYPTGAFIFQHRNDSATFVTCWALNANLGVGQTYFYDRVFVTNNPGNSAVFIVNSTTDNGVDKLQVNGSMSVGSIKATGNVGIFNSSPIYAVHVGDGTSTRQVVINGLNSGTAGGSSIAVQTNSLTTMMFGNKSNIIGGAYDGQPVFGFGGSTNSLQFYNFNTLVTSAMISSGDRFLIGTTTDNGVDKLQVSGSGTFTNGVNMATSSGKVAIRTTTQTANLTVLGGYSIGGSIPTDWNFMSAGRMGVVSGNKGFYYDIIGGSYAEFSTFDWGTSQPFNMVFQGNGGRVLVATTTDNGVDGLQVNGSAIASTLKVNTSGQTVSISSYYNGGTGKNIWIGGGGLSSTSASEQNTSLGVDALLNNTSGYRNSAFGSDALRLNTTGFMNMAFGHSSLESNTTGNRNMAIGQGTLNVSNSSDNAAVGSQTLIALTSGGRNVGIGSNALFYATTGSSNVAVGCEAGKFITGGGNNVTSGTSVYLGDDTRASANGNSNEIVIGHNAIGQGSNSVTLGNSSITQTLLRGAVTGGSFIKSGGTSSQVLYADGGVKQITSGTAAPSGGNDGDIYLQYV